MRACVRACVRANRATRGRKTHISHSLWDVGARAHIKATKEISGMDCLEGTPRAPFDKGNLEKLAVRNRNEVEDGAFGDSSK